MVTNPVENVENRRTAGDCVVKAVEQLLSVAVQIRHQFFAEFLAFLFWGGELGSFFFKFK